MKNITKIIWLWVLILLPLICYSADSTVEKLPPSSPASESIFYVVDKPFTSGASDNRLSLGNLLLWMATQNWTFSGAVTLPVITLADDSTLTLPAAAVDEGWTTGLFGCGPDGTCAWTNIADLEATIPISGEITDEQVACWESSETPGTNKLKSCGTKTTDNSTATHLLCKDDSGEIENCTLAGLAISGTTSPTITVTSAPAITSGASPTVDAAGEIAVDTTTDQLQYYGGAKRALPYIQFLSFVIPAPAEADDINIMKAPYGMTILGINCIVKGNTSATGQLQECDSAAANCADLDSDITCDADAISALTKAR